VISSHFDDAILFASFLLDSGWDQDLYIMGQGLPYGDRNSFLEAALLSE
jgi:hypothetical protein